MVSYYGSNCLPDILETCILENGSFGSQTIWVGDFMKTDVLALTLWSRTLRYISEAEVVSKGRNKLYQTNYKEMFSALYNLTKTRSMTKNQIHPGF